MRWYEPLRFVGLAVCSVSFAIAPGLVRAQTPACDALPAEAKNGLAQLFATLHPYDGCDETFARCLAKKPRAPVVVRLANDICRQVAAGRERKEIEHALARRAQSMLPVGRPATFALDETMSVGDAGAAVTVVVYACARCPFCRVVVPALYREVTEGKLAGKVRLSFRAFPLKDHAGSLEGGLAMLSAAKLGQFWPMLLRIYANYDAFCADLLPEWAASLGLDRAAFSAGMSDRATRDALVASKQEGIRNKVEATPTLFIDGRKYVYENRIEVILDVLEEAVEAKAGVHSAERALTASP